MLLQKYYKSIRLKYHYACRRLGIQKYAIHQICLPEQKLLYIPMPKNACSSIKYALFEIEKGKTFDPDEFRKLGYRDIHDYYQKQPQAFRSVSDLESKTSYTTFTVIRDPVKRLISCYRNRVVDLKDLEKTRIQLKLKGLTPDPDLNTFVRQLEEYRAANKVIEHHSRAQYKFLGGRLDYVDRVFPIEKIRVLTEFLQQYVEGLELPAKKADGTSYNLCDLSPEALEKAIQFYKEDYNLLKDYYTPEEIREEYKISIT